MSSSGVFLIGTLWGERFKSGIVENGETLVNCLAYIDLNKNRGQANITFAMRRSF